MQGRYPRDEPVDIVSRETLEPLKPTFSEIGHESSRVLHPFDLGRFRQPPLPEVGQEPFQLFVEVAADVIEGNSLCRREIDRPVLNKCAYAPSPAGVLPPDGFAGTLFVEDGQMLGDCCNDIACVVGVTCHLGLNAPAKGDHKTDFSRAVSSLQEGTGNLARVLPELQYIRFHPLLLSV